MTFAFGTRSAANLVGVHPKLIAVDQKAIAISSVDFGVPEKSTRTLAEEEAKVKAGTSHTLKSMHIIQADGYGHAIDNVPWINGAFTWADLEPFYVIAAAVQSAAIGLGTRVTWGGTWSCLNDLPLGADALKAAFSHYATTFHAIHGRAPFQDAPHVQLT